MGIEQTIPMTHLRSPSLKGMGDNDLFRTFSFAIKKNKYIFSLLPPSLPQNKVFTILPTVHSPTPSTSNNHNEFIPIKTVFTHAQTCIFYSNLTANNNSEFCQWKGSVAVTHLPPLTAFHSMF